MNWIIKPVLSVFLHIRGLELLPLQHTAGVLEETIFSLLLDIFRKCFLSSNTSSLLVINFLNVYMTVFHTTSCLQQCDLFPFLSLLSTQNGIWTFGYQQMSAVMLPASQQWYFKSLNYIHITNFMLIIWRLYHIITLFYKVQYKRITHHYK